MLRGVPQACMSMSGLGGFLELLAFLVGFTLLIYQVHFLYKTEGLQRANS